MTRQADLANVIDSSDWKNKEGRSQTMPEASFLLLGSRGRGTSPDDFAVGNATNRRQTSRRKCDTICCKAGLHGMLDGNNIRRGLLMKLVKIYAFEVYPQKGESSIERPKGGRLSINAALRNELERLVCDTGLSDETPISFRVADPDIKKRENSVRNMLMKVGFGQSRTSSKEAAALALKLSLAMDNRSNPFLFIVSGFEMTY